MSRCPITYEVCGNSRYSLDGLKKLSKSLTDLKPFPYTAEEQRKEAVARAGKMSIQGLQPKLSAVLNPITGLFEVVDLGGRYIIKPQNSLYEELPQNEDLTLRLAETVGIRVPFHGLLYSKDGTFSLFVKRFDRTARNKKLHVEDFAQLAGRNRETKYRYSMERLIGILDHCTFPIVERQKIFRLTLFNYLVGNEDMHLKNFSLIRRQDLVEISPAYDLLNSTIAITNPQDEIALPLNGKKSGLTRHDLVEYFGEKRLGLTDKAIGSVLRELENVIPRFVELVRISFLSKSMKEKYLDILNQRRVVLQLDWKTGSRLKN